MKRLTGADVLVHEDDHAAAVAGDVLARPDTSYL